MRAGAVAALVLGATLAVSPCQGQDAAAPRLELLTREVDLELARIPDTETLCAAGALVRFRLAREARVSLAVGGDTATGAVDGGPVRTLSGVPLGAGLHAIVLSAEPRTGFALGTRPFSLTAIEDSTAAPALSTGTLRDERIDRPVLPVGRTFVSGVDLLDGHLVLQATDLKLEGRHLALDLARTYSSAGRSAAGLAGAGWRLSYESALTPVPECGLALVRTADGSTQMFVAAPGSGNPGLRPQRGYHTRLRRNADGSFDFFDKAAYQHHFAGRVAQAAASLRLEWIQEPHGDRIALAYDAAGRLSAASEWQPRLGPVRTLTLEYASAGGKDRLVAAEAWGLGLRVDYQHDAQGNLVAAQRTDREHGTTVDRYEYSSSDPRDAHQLLAATPQGEGRTGYGYGPRAGPTPADSPGAGDAGDPLEFVREVNPAAGQGTGFVFDRSQARAGIFRTEVRAPGGVTTRYLLNADGNPLEIDEPEGISRKVTRFIWDAAHVVKTSEEGPGGRRLSYGHDDSGNLTLEQDVARPGAAPRTTSYGYDPRFNKLVRKQDVEGRRSAWTLDAQTGDLLRQEEPDGKVKAWAYDRDGCLREERDGSGRTLYRRPDTFCNATEIERPDGTILRRRYDARGGLMDETKSLSR